MARPAKWSDDDLLDAAQEAIHANGPTATVGQIATAARAPVGSIYHRFGSREELLVRLWLRDVRRFQVGVLGALEQEDVQRALESAAVHVADHCRAHPAEANILTMFRHQDLINRGPASLRDEIATVNDQLTAAMSKQAARRYGRTTSHRMDILRTACQQSPYGLVRPFIGLRNHTPPMPAWLPAAVRASTTAILTVAD